MTVWIELREKDCWVLTMTLGSLSVEQKVPSSTGKNIFLPNTDTSLSVAQAISMDLNVAPFSLLSNFLSGLALKAWLCAAVAATYSVLISSKWLSDEVKTWRWIFLLHYLVLQRLAVVLLMFPRSQAGISSEEETALSPFLFGTEGSVRRHGCPWTSWGRQEKTFYSPDFSSQAPSHCSVLLPLRWSNA